MSTWGVGDFAETINHYDIKLESPVTECLAAWGEGDGPDKDHFGYSHEWSGGFVVKLENGRFAYIMGGCDYSGWGCQDGATVEYFDEQPDLSKLRYVEWREDSFVPQDLWDLNPPDANAWIKAGMPDYYNWEHKYIETLSN